MIQRVQRPSPPAAAEPKPQRVPPLDAAWLYVESPETPMYVGCLQIFSAPPHAPRGYTQKLVRELRAAHALAPPFSLKLGHAPLSGVLPVWVEERHPDMDYHLQCETLPPPGGEAELGQLLARLQAESLDLARPLWNCRLIEGLAGGRYALFTKIHHSLMDGIGGMQVLQAALSPDARHRNMPAPWARHHDGAGASLHGSLLHGGLHHALQLALTQLRAGPGLLRAFVTLAQAALPNAHGPLTAPYTAPISVLNGRTSTDRRFATLQLSLARVHELAHRAGVTLNDVFLALCASALRRYLQERDALPDKPLSAGIPVSVRPAGDTRVGTAITFVLSTLATDVDDPRQRLQRIHAATAAAKEHLHGMDRAALTEYTLLLMAPYIVELMAGLGGHGHPVFNLAISNVPGPEQPLYFNGARLEAMYPMSILTHGQSLNITTVSYAGQLNVGYTACRRAVPHVERLAAYTAEALTELEALYPAAPVAGRSKRPRKTAATGAR